MGYGGMIHCDGCGFNVEPEDAREPVEYGDGSRCETCAKCEACPDLRESYRRGYNQGLDDLAMSVQRIVTNSNLRKHARPILAPAHPQQPADDAAEPRGR